MNLSKILKGSLPFFFVLLISAIVGLEVFQGQKSPMVINNKMFDYDESDPYIDRPTREALMHVVESTDEDLDIITDADGFDNFEIGVDFAEQMLVSNPRNPLNMQFGVNNSSTGQNAYYTLNGYDWTSSNPAYHSSICCDPWSAWDSLGRLTYGSGVSGQYIYRSSNGGVSYGTPILSVNGNDRNTLAADQTNGPYSNYLYAAITPGNFARSTNNGLNWTQTYSSSNTIPGTMIAVGPNGSVQGGCVIYVTNTGSTANVTYTFHRSTNGGANFTVMSSLTTAGYVGTLNSAGRLVINNGRTRPYPMIAMDNSYGPYRGRLYLVYASNVPAGNGYRPDIRLRYSSNQGANWSNAVTVNDDTTGHQWFPAIWCEKETGRLYIKWYDTRENPLTYACNVYATYTDNGGTSFAPNQRLTTQSWIYPNPSCSPNTNCYRGDYDGMTANPKAGFAVWYDGRLGTYKNVGSYFPDFGMLASPSSQTVNTTNDSRNFLISIPSVKLYTDVTTFSAAVSPAPGSGSIEFEFLGGNTLSSYPNTKYMKVKTVGNVTAGNYTITITGQGSNGTPVHKRTVTLTVNSSVIAAPCENFTDLKFPPANFFADYSGTFYWERFSQSAYNIGTGSARFNSWSATNGTTQSIVSNNFTSAGINTYLTFDEAYQPWSGGNVDSLIVESSVNSGVSYTTLARLWGGLGSQAGPLNSVFTGGGQFTPSGSQWRPKIYLLPVGTNKVRLKAVSGFGNDIWVDNICVQVLSPAVNNSIGLASQGMFIPTDPFWSFLDTIKVFLHRTDFPNIAVDSSTRVMGSSAVCNNLLFDKALNGNYYRVIQHRNSIETWSNSGFAYTRGSNTHFNFINPDGQAYGNNQAIVSSAPLYRGMYSGDCNQDSTIDGADLLIIDNDASTFVLGYNVSDLNGDFTTDGSDYLIADNNASSFITRVAPLGGEPEPPPAFDVIPTFKSDAEKEKYELTQKLNKENTNQNNQLKKSLKPEEFRKLINDRYKNNKR